MGKICCVTGHRPYKLPFGTNEAHPIYQDLKEKLHAMILDLEKKGYTYFISGMAMGVDLLFAQLVLERKQYNPEIILEGAIPCPSQTNRWPLSQRKKYDRILPLCDILHITSTSYNQFCMMQRNRYMVEKADLVIAVFDGQPGGTANTVAYARNLQKEVIVIDPRG